MGFKMWQRDWSSTDGWRVLLTHLTEEKLLMGYEENLPQCELEMNQSKITTKYVSYSVSHYRYYRYFMAYSQTSFKCCMLQFAHAWTKNIKLPVFKHYLLIRLQRVGPPHRVNEDEQTQGITLY